MLVLAFFGTKSGFPESNNRVDSKKEKSLPI